MANPLDPSQLPQREVLKETPSSAAPEKLSPESSPAKPESPGAPEAGETALAETIAAKQEEIKAEQTGEAPSAAALAAPAAGSVPKVSGYVSASDLKKLAGLPRPEQVKFLTEIVYQKGLDRAITTVRHLNDPYLFDLLHDTLVDELYQKLKGPRLKK